MIKRLVAQELVLSFVPDPEQRLWRTVTRRKHQLTRDKVRFQNQLESLLEQAHIKLSSFVSDLLALSARRMLKAIAEGETDPAAVAALADCRLPWMILRKGIRYEERGPAVKAKSQRARTARMIKALQKLGYRVEGGPLPAGCPA